MVTREPIFEARATSLPVLRYLVAVAEHRHFGRAAEAARISQPTLSALIGQWEKRMKCQVFEREAHGVRITPAGERVVLAARQALDAIRAMEAAASEAKPPFFGAVRFGVIPTVGPYALPFVTSALEKAFPGLELPIREGTTADLIAALDAGRIDVAMLALTSGMTERFAVDALYDEPFLVALPRGHRLAEGKAVATADLANERLLLLDEGHCLRDQALALCGHRAGQSAGADYRATSLETLRQIVASGAGVTILPALAVGDDDRRLVLRPFAGEPAFRTIVLLWRRHDSRVAAYPLLAGPIRKHLPRGQVTAR